VLIWLVFVVFGFGVLIYHESELGVLVDAEGNFSTPMRMWLSVLLYAFAAGAILSSMHYARFKDRLAAYIAFPQMVLVFSCLMALIGGQRYDLWWYLQRVVLVFGHLTVFIGLLSEYVRLLRRESEGLRLLEAIMENIPIGLAVTGGPPHFPIVRVSRHGLDMSQQPVADLTGSPSGAHQAEWRILLPDGVTRPTADQMPLYRASHLGENVRNVEFVMETQSGEEIPVLVNASPIRDAQGNVVAAINTWFDIVDRKRAEGILRESEALYRAIASSIPNGGVFVVDKDLRYLIAEGQIIPKFDFSREKLEGYTVSEIFDA
jgi:PAS domain-containing protein